jgi:hypothetical protein
MNPDRSTSVRSKTDAPDQPCESVHLRSNHSRPNRDLRSSARFPPSSEWTRRCSGTRGGAIAGPCALNDSYGYSSIRTMIHGEDNSTRRWGVSSPRMAVETTLATTRGDSAVEGEARWEITATPMTHACWSTSARSHHSIAQPNSFSADTSKHRKRETKAAARAPAPVWRVIGAVLWLSSISIGRRRREKGDVVRPRSPGF